jgi:hypothetical protein
MNLSSWAPKAGQSFDLLSSDFPEAERESVWVTSLEQLKTSISNLEESMNSTVGIINRMKEHSKSIIEEEDSKASSRLCGAMDRLMNEIDELNNRWGG